MVPCLHFSINMLSTYVSFRKKGVITNRDAISMALKETLRYGLFLGTFAGTFVSIDEIIGNLAGHRRYTLFYSDRVFQNLCRFLNLLVILFDCLNVFL